MSRRKNLTHPSLHRNKKLQRRSPNKRTSYPQQASSDEPQFAGNYHLKPGEEDDFMALSIEEKVVEPNAADWKLEVNSLHVTKCARTRKSKKIDVTLRAGDTFVQLTVDTGSPSSFLNMTRVNKILNDKFANAKFLNENEAPGDIFFTDYNSKRIKTQGVLIMDITSEDWKVKQALFAKDAC